ncbi:MAG: 4Fe-4S dicluster domain-containing protein [Prevotellaceae bacterium]|jgi:polyferredoxin|nr:4Fe-4S dicluster domain-containing protein [Prevotellaceae bacterium]
MLKRIRTTIAIVFFVLITLLFLDFTGTLHRYAGWLADIQFLPAVLALHVGIIVGLVALTLLFGRIYCSVICPLGVFQDIITRKAKWLTKRKKFSYSPALTWLRWTVLALFILSLAFGVSAVVSLLAPYGAYGRIASSIFAPIYDWGNNFFAYLAERANSYAFYRTDVRLQIALIPGLIVAATLVALLVLAWRNGRTYCNTVCPVGTVLGFLSRFSLFKVRIDAEKCTKCNACSRVCKASCMDIKNQQIDYSRCVACYDCLDKCKFDSLTYGLPKKSAPAPAAAAYTGEKDGAPSARRQFFSLTALLASTALLKAQETKRRDGGFAPIAERVEPERGTPLTPPGSRSARNLKTRCVSCQLCVSACPSRVLAPNTSLSDFMQPSMSYERGYCRPECTECSAVCPTEAITKLTKEEKSSVQIGHAVWVRERCIVESKKQSCGNCSRHCPTSAIKMVPIDPSNRRSLQIPAVDENRCIGCGACEYVCPSRPLSAIYVVGHEEHKSI